MVVMRGQKRVEDARERAYVGASILFVQSLYEDGWIAGVKPGNDDLQCIADAEKPGSPTSVAGQRTLLTFRFASGASTIARTCRSTRSATMACASAVG